MEKRTEPNRQLKIAFLVGKFPALSETFILDQITGLIDAGHQVDIYASSRPAEAISQPLIETYRLLERTHYFEIPRPLPQRAWKALRMIRERGPRLLRALEPRSFGPPAASSRQGAYWRQAASLRSVYLLYPFLHKGPYDILHCHFGPVGLTGAQIKDLGVPGKLVVTFHGNDVSKFVKSNGEDAYQHLFARADLLMPVSAYWQQRLIELGADPARVRVHHMGIDPDQIPYAPRALPGGRPGQEEICLLSVGRLVEKKGIRFALLAVSRLVQRHPEWKIRYNIIGSGEQEAELKQMIARLGLQDTAHLLGPKTRDEVYRVMQESHIFLLPSITDAQGDQEGIPVVLMEAMASGMPVLSTRHSGIPELVQEGSSGYLVPEGDVDGLVAGLERLLSHPQSWAEMGRSGRSFVEDAFNIHKLNAQLIEAYRFMDSVSGSAPSAGPPAGTAR